MEINQACSGCTKSLKTRDRDLIVRKAADLSSINVWRRHDSIYLRLPQLTANDNAAWESRIQQSYSECGCTLGAYSLGGALVILSILLVIKVAQGDFDFYLFSRFSIILLIGSIVAGKLIGILIGRISTVVSIKQLQDIISIDRKL